MLLKHLNPVQIWKAKREKAATPSYRELLLQNMTSCCAREDKPSIENCRRKLENLKSKRSMWTQPAPPVLSVQLHGCGGGWWLTLDGAVGCRFLSECSITWICMVLLLPCWNPVTLLRWIWTLRVGSGWQGKVSGLENWRWYCGGRFGLSVCWEGFAVLPWLLVEGDGGDDRMGQTEDFFTL